MGPIQTPITTSGQVTDDALPGLTGTAEANATVVIYDNGAQVATVQATETGEWSWTPTTALSNGSHTFTTSAIDAAGNLSETSPGFTLIVDTLKPTAPVIALAIDDVDPVTGALTSGRTTNDQQPVLTGTSEPNARVQIFNGETLIGEGIANANGSWSIEVNTQLSDDVYSFTAVAIDAAGNISDPSAPFTLTIDTQLPDAPVLVSVTDDVGEPVDLTQWPVDQRRQTDPQRHGRGGQHGEHLRRHHPAGQCYCWGEQRLELYPKRRRWLTGNIRSR
ncbi:Uncharacterised protein [Leclercia adecarboxylata]|uniref:Bacterial Ig-like domain-containing protein n=1 Tax=Leclercia adecarboxylata TaxID=83655 RepID=A0A4U9IC86_9ENTR|nr:Uncharacterised protein [Leclercia adecarboxylata]